MGQPLRSQEDWSQAEREGEYRRIKRAFTSLYSWNTRNITVAIGQLREDGEITKNMVLFIERNDYPPGAQFLCLRLSTVRRLTRWLDKIGWTEARRLRPEERARLDRAAGVPLQ